MIVADYSKTVSTLDEMSEVQKNYYHIDASLGSVFINDDWEVVVGTSKYNITQQGIESLTKILGIPYKYAVAIPIDLFQENMDRLKGISEDHKNALISICIRADVSGETEGTVVNFYKYKLNKKNDMPLPCMSLDTSNLMEYFSSDKFKVEKCVIGDAGAVIDFSDSDLGHVNLIEEGDVINIGYRLINPFTQTAEALEMRLIFIHDGFCMKLPPDFGKARVNLTKDLGDQDRYFAMLMESHAKWISSKYVAKDLSDLVKGTRGRIVKYRFFVPLLRKINSMSESVCALVFDIKDWKEESKYYAEELDADETGGSGFEFWKVIFDIGKEVKQFTAGVDKLPFENYMSVIFQMSEKQAKLYPEQEGDSN
jgi:hypothetical protein